MARIDLEIYSSDPGEVAAIEAYWRLADDGVSWDQPVAAIQYELGLKQPELRRIIQTCAAAYLPEVKCPECGKPYPVKSRSDLAQLLRRPETDVPCSACRATAQLEQERAEEERATQRQAALMEAWPVFETEPIVVPALTLFEAVALHALFSDPAVEDAGMTTPAGDWPADRPWAPDLVRSQYLWRLAEAEPPKVLVHPLSDPNAFEWEDGSPTGVYLGQAGYYLLGPEGDLRARPPRLLNELNRIFRDGPWPEAWLGQWRDLWDELALADVSAYLDLKLNEHHLRMKQGDGTRAVLVDALATFSVGQVFNLISRAVRDSAAYYQRGGVSRNQAANSAVSRIGSTADRARAEGWDLKHFKRPWNLPLSAMSEIFFGKVMWQADMMPVVARDAQPPPHAWAKRGGEAGPATIPGSEPTVD